jgi:glycosyltransferase involved in cell wall biosynthesis
VGDGQDREALAALIRELGVGDRVELRGHADDVTPALREAHAILASSRQEGLGIAFLEAMAMGRPVVGLDTGGIREVTDPDTALVTPPARETDDARVDALVQRIREAQASLDTLGERGVRARERVLARFSRVAMAKGYAEVYRSVTRRPT